MPSVTYQEMIQDALLTLNEGKKGSSRQSLWKCIKTKYPEHDSDRDYKLFIVRLKKLCENPSVPIAKNPMNAARFHIEDKMREKIRRQKASGKDVTVKVFSTESTTKAEKKRKDAMKAKERAKAKAEKKRAAAKAKKAKAAEKKKNSAKGKKSAAKGKSTKAKMQNKAKDNKKVKGSKAANDKKSNAKKMQEKKAALNKKANQNAAKKAQQAKSKPVEKRGRSMGAKGKDDKAKAKGKAAASTLPPRTESPLSNQQLRLVENQASALPRRLTSQSKLENLPSLPSLARSP